MESRVQSNQTPRICLAGRQNDTAAVENGFGDLKKLGIDFSVTVDD